MKKQIWKKNNTPLNRFALIFKQHGFKVFKLKAHFDSFRPILRSKVFDKNFSKFNVKKDLDLAREILDMTKIKFKCFKFCRDLGPKSYVENSQDFFLNFILTRTKFLSNLLYT